MTRRNWSSLRIWIAFHAEMESFLKRALGDSAGATRRWDWRVHWQNRIKIDKQRYNTQAPTLFIPTFQARLLRKCSNGNILYKTLKYLASVSGQHFPSYFIKVTNPEPKRYLVRSLIYQELTLSYIIHTNMNNVQKTTIIESLNEMLVFAENNGYECTNDSFLFISYTSHVYTEYPTPSTPISSAVSCTRAATIFSTCFWLQSVPSFIKDHSSRSLDKKVFSCSKKRDQEKETRVLAPCLVLCFMIRSFRHRCLQSQL